MNQQFSSIAKQLFKTDVRELHPTWSEHAIDYMQEQVHALAKRFDMLAWLAERYDCEKQEKRKTKTETET